MASYVNRRGESIKVSDSHIETAIKLKLELQKESPSGRTSWARHKRMMVQEGFDDSSSNESYRQMIKQEQKKRDMLPEAPKYAEMVSSKKLESVRDAIGEMYIAKRHAQNTHRELNKVKRELSDELTFLESVEEAIKSMLLGQKEAKIKELNIDNEKTKKTMIACLSDIHYGASVDIEGRIYNTELAHELILDYANRLIDMAIKENVELIHVVNIGDLVEHTNMRTQNTYSSEKLLSEQVTEISDIIIEFLTVLADSGYKVTYSAIAGNHDRIIGNKNNSLFGEHIVSISNKIIETFTKYSGYKNIEYVPTESYHHILSVEDKQFLFVHGDINSLKKDSVLAEQSALHGIHFDAIIGGHIHHYTVNEVAEDRYVVTFGSIKGTDEFSLKTIASSASRSQGVVLVDDTGEFEIRKVKL